MDDLNQVLARVERGMTTAADAAVLRRALGAPGFLPQQLVAEAIRARGYRAGWTPAQFAARQVTKLTEELSELARYVEVDDLDYVVWLWDLRDVGELAREAFDNGSWDGVVEDVERVKDELADIQVVVFVLADVLGEMSGGEFDVVKAAMCKSAKDISRGVRGQHAEITGSVSS